MHCRIFTKIRKICCQKAKVIDNAFENDKILPSMHFYKLRDCLIVILEGVYDLSKEVHSVITA